jgi:hypothetical protein
LEFVTGPEEVNLTMPYEELQPLMNWNQMEPGVTNPELEPGMLNVPEPVPPKTYEQPMPEATPRPYEAPMPTPPTPSIPMPKIGESEDTFGWKKHELDEAVPVDEIQEPLITPRAGLSRR